MSVHLTVVSLRFTPAGYFTVSCLYCNLSHLSFTLCVAMTFTPPNPKETLRAIGNIKDLPIHLQRALNPSDDFETIPVPKSGDWLAEHDEPGRSPFALSVCASFSSVSDSMWLIVIRNSLIFTKEWALRMKSGGYQNV